MTNSTWTQRLALAVIVAFAGCGPQVRITEPANGSTVDTSSIVAQMEFDAPARTFQVVLDGNDVSRGFFLTDSQAAGKIDLGGDGDHVLSVDYLSKSGFEDSAQSIFTVTAPATVSGIVTDPTSISVAVGAKKPLTVIAQLTDNTTKDVTNDTQTVIQPVDSNVALVTPGAQIKGVAVGSTTIAVTYGTFSAKVPVTVTAS